MSQLPHELFQHWIHSREEDRGDVRVYRPADYDFPPARGRDGFELKRDGTLIRYAIAAADGTTKRTERWEEVDAKRFQLGESGEIWEVESSTAEILTIRRHAAPP
jgi:hypothetical protein